MGSKLVGCGSAIPTLSVSNDDLSKIVETSDEWIAARTGIRNRRVLSGNYVFFYSFNKLGTLVSPRLNLYCFCLLLFTFWLTGNRRGCAQTVWHISFYFSSFLT